MTDDRQNNCSICLEKLEREDAPVLTMGHYGYPRFICAECEGLIETALKSRDTEAAEAAMARLGETVGNNSADDHAVLEAMENIFSEATARIEAIKNGTYDFSKDDVEADVLEDIPEELLETEEDKKETEAEEAANVKFNKVMDVVTAAVFAAAAVIFIIYFITR